MSFNTILNGFTEISKVSSRTEKEKIFNRLLDSDGDRLKQVMDYTYNPFWNYGLTVSDTAVWIEPDYSFPSSNALWDGFAKRLLDPLRNRKISGAAARIQVIRFMQGCSVPYQYWFTRILNRDLKIGLAQKTVSKLVPGLLPKTSPMLCDVLEFNKNYKGWYAEPKLDGLRAIVAVENGKAIVVSRSGKRMYNVDHIIEEVEALGIDNAVFDGEFAGITFKQAISVLHTQMKHSASKAIKFWIFDTLPISDWKEQKSTIPLHVRKAMLKKILTKRNKLKLESLKFVNSQPLMYGDKREIEIVCNLQVENGYEGIVIKKQDSVYEWKRTKTWLKLKPFYEADLEIVGIEEGKGNRRGRVGALVVKGRVKYDGSGSWKEYNVKTEIGTGLSEKQTIEYYKNPPIGKMAEIRFQEVSDWDIEKKVYALKFARLRRMRPDKD